MYQFFFLQTSIKINDVGPADATLMYPLDKETGKINRQMIF